MHEKVDLKAELVGYRAVRGRFDLVDVPPRQFLMVDGHGDPNTSSLFTGALETLYPVAYALKMASKTDRGRDYVVPPLEGLWWADDLEVFTRSRDKDRWSWTLMLLVPDWLDRSDVEAAVERTAARSGPSRSGPARLADLRLASFDEGPCLQTLHVGTFDDEAPVLARLHHEVVPERGFRLTGRHHEIYLGDQRRVAPERMRTILRQPVVPAG